MLAILGLSLSQGVLSAFGLIPNMDLTVHDLVGDLVNNTIDNANIAVSSKSSFSSVTLVPLVPSVSIEPSYMEVSNGDGTLSYEASSHSMLDPDQSAFTTITLTSRLNTGANTAATVPVPSIPSVQDKPHPGPGEKDRNTSSDIATTSACTPTAVPLAIPSISSVIAISSTTPIFSTTTQIIMADNGGLDRDKLALKDEVGAAATALSNTAQRAFTWNNEVLEAKKDAGSTKCNLSCDSEALHSICANSPYFAKCTSDSLFGACGGLVIVEAHDPCLVHCSCVAGQHEEQTLQVDKIHNEFEGLD